jgi:BASS family bile acid:Na+ symporter
VISWEQAERYVIPVQLLLAMFGMGATLSWEDFKNVFKHPSGVGIGVGLQWIFVPLLALAFGKLLTLSPGWAMGLLIVSVTPGGAFSNLLTYLARGHLALSVSVTAVATVASTVSAPLILSVLARSHLPAQFSFPTGRILFEVTAYLLVPLFAGMLVYRYVNARAALISKLSIWLSLSLVVFLAVLAMTAGRVKIQQFGWGPPAYVIAFAVLINLATIELCRLLRRYDDESVALSIEVSVRNGGVGLLLLRFFFPGQIEQAQMLYTVLLYTGLQVWVPVPAILLHRFGKSPLYFRARHTRPEE